MSTLGGARAIGLIAPDRSRGRSAARRSVVLGTLVSVGANTVAAVIVLVLLLFVLPLPPEADAAVVRNLVAIAIYLPLALLIGVVTGVRDVRRRLGWLHDGTPPSPAERRATVGIPLACTGVHMALWLVGAVIFSLLNAPVSVLLAVVVGVTVVMGGLVSAALNYLLVERVNATVLSLALADAPLHGSRGSGVAWRTFVSWLLGTALPVGGLVLLNGVALGLDIPRTELAVASVVLGLIALGVGLLVMIVFGRSVSAPLKSLRVALGRVAEGDTGVRVPVSDATEVGIVQTGFNQMVVGLAERDRVRDLFGRHVGQDVARRALEEGVELGGEVRDVAVLYVDVIGSTGLAEHRGPVEAIDGLNRVFAVVLEVVEAHGGTVTAFAGDAALCVWGAPLQHPAPAEGALAAARQLATTAAADDTVLAVGIGVASGPVVAGNIGASQRVEYTVIGDAVNTAARLCDHAKSLPGHVAADAATVDRVEVEEQRCWESVGEVVLRGRSGPTGVCAPVRPAS